VPIHKQGSGWQWGNHGKVYASREGAVKQAQAAHANGYKEPSHEQKMQIIKKAVAKAKA
jgi:hypothetical protein